MIVLLRSALFNEFDQGVVLELVLEFILQLLLVLLIELILTATPFEHVPILFVFLVISVALNALTLINRQLLM